MILVEWKGDDERPYRLSFHPRFTVVSAPDADARRLLVEDLVRAFSPTQPGAREEPRIISEKQPPNVLRPNDLGWLMGRATRAGETTDELWTRLIDEGNDEVAELVARLDALDANLAITESALLEAQDEERQAEGQLDAATAALVAEAPTTDVGPLPEHARENLERLLTLQQGRIDALGEALERKIVDPSALLELLERFDATAASAELEEWRVRKDELEKFLEAEAVVAANTRPPTWLVDQTRHEFDEARESLEVFAALERFEHEPDFLETAARRRYAEAVAMWEEIEPFLDEHGDERRTQIQLLIEAASQLVGRELIDAHDAVAAIANELQSADAHDGTRLAILAALHDVQVFVAKSENAIDVARTWAKNRSAERELQTHQREQLAELQEDQRNAQAVLQRVLNNESEGEGHTDLDALEILDARKQAEVDEARYAYEFAVAVLDEAQQRYDEEFAASNDRRAQLGAEIEGARRRSEYFADQAAEPQSGLSRGSVSGPHAWGTSPTLSDAAVVERTATHRLRDLIAELLMRTDGDPVPLIVDGVIDNEGGVDRVALLDALHEVAVDQQIVYVTGDEAVVAWAESQNADDVAVRFITLR